MPASFWFCLILSRPAPKGKPCSKKPEAAGRRFRSGGKGLVFINDALAQVVCRGRRLCRPEKVVNSPWISEKPLHPAGGQRRPPLRRKRKVLSDPPKISVEQLPPAPASCGRFPGSFFCLPILRAPVLKVPVGAVVVAFVIDVVEPADGQDKIIRIIIDVDPRGIQPGTHGL